MNSPLQQSNTLRTAKFAQDLDVHVTANIALVPRDSTGPGPLQILRVAFIGIGSQMRL